MKSRILLPLAKIGHNMFLFRRPPATGRSQYAGTKPASADLAPHLPSSPGSAERIAYLAKWYADGHGQNTPFLYGIDRLSEEF